MTDSVAVFPPGYRLTDSATGAPISGATIAFFDAGTTNPQTVFGDKNLLVPLGTSVVTDALGRPTSDGTAPTDIFVGTAAYKVVITDANAVVIETKDNRPGAVVSASSVNVAVTALFPVVTKSLNYTVVQADQNTTFPINCSSGDVTVTLPSAVPGTGTGNVSSAGWTVKIQHAGSANRVIIKTVSSQTLSGGVASSATQLILVRQGEEVTLSSDGGNWRVTSHTPAAPRGYTTGVIQVVSRLATAPGSPALGDKYILTGIGGAWSSFAVGDIATWNGASWGNQTPPSNCGWVAYVQGESLYYRYQSSAWVIETATTSLPGTVTLADAAAMEGETSGRVVTADLVKRNPGVAKAWGSFSGPATLSVKASYGVSSIVRNGTGNYTVNLSVNMSSVNYAVIVSAGTGGTTGASIHNAYATTRAVGSFVISTSDQNFALFDDSQIDFVVLGDQ